MVNTASECGFARRTYPELASLLDKFKEKGLKVALFPCNQFRNQEPNEIGEIKQSVMKYSGDFILFDKVDVKGEKMHPVYAYLCRKKTGWFGSTIKWNFTKFLVSRRGEIVKRYGPMESISENTIEDLCAETS